jgi:acetyltransferase-like isoleucine patch superfamily enzyme
MTRKLYQKVKKFYFKKRITKAAKSVGCKLKVNHKSAVNNNTHLGNNVNFNGLFIRGDGNVFIGSNFHSGPDILILTRNHNFDKGKKIPYDETYIRKSVTIEDNVWLGARVIILPGVKINEGAIVQAGAVVVNEVPKCAIVGGNPATVIKHRDIEHYEKLKKESKFH